MEKLKIPYPVIVEGKYDRAKLETVIDADIITTDGFGIFKNSEKQALLRALAAKTPLIVLTDPDGAGGVIRSHVSGIIPPDRLIKIYVPRIPGKEKRKAEPSAEGVLGVEGIDAELLREVFMKYVGEKKKSGQKITTADLYADGFTGCSGSQEKRDRFGSVFGLPTGMNQKAFLCALNYICDLDEYKEKVRKFRSGPQKRQ